MYIDPFESFFVWGWGWGGGGPSECEDKSTMGGNVATTWNLGA